MENVVKKMIFAGSIVTASLVVTVLMAQETPKPPGPVSDHAWLKQLVGEWESETEMVMAPGQPPHKSKGTESVRAIGEFWVVADIKADTPMGIPLTAVMTLGYDPQKKKYVGTWIDSMLNHLWQYEGTLDPTGKILTLEAEGPNMIVPGKLTKYRDVIEFKSKDHRTLTSSALGDDGQWTVFGTANHRRKS